MRISIIGCGNMGSAIALALGDAEYDVSIYDSAREKAEECTAANERITVLESLEEASGSDAIIIAVKPQVLPSLYLSLREIETGLWISIAAGVPLSVLEDGDNLATERTLTMDFSAAERAEEDREKQEDGIGRLLQKTRENEIRR